MFCGLVLYCVAGTTAALGLLMCLPQFTRDKGDVLLCVCIFNKDLIKKVNTGFNTSWLLLEYACISQRSLKVFLTEFAMQLTSGCLSHCSGCLDYI